MIDWLWNVLPCTGVDLDPGEGLTMTGMSEIGDDKPWVKMVAGRTMLIPTLELVKTRAEVADQNQNVLQLRQSLAEEFGTDATCPVTVRRHLQALGYPVRRGTDRIKLNASGSSPDR